MLRSILPSWASSRLYPDGPKVGEVSKVRPTSLAPGGIRPGEGAKPSAEELNWMLSALTKDVRRLRYLSLAQNWVDTGITLNSVLANADVFAVCSKSGWSYFNATNSVRLCRFGVMPPYGEEIADPSAAVTVAYDGLRVGRYVYILGTNGTNFSGYRFDSQNDDLSSPDVTSSIAGTRCRGAFDSVNNRIIVAGDDGVSNAVFASIPAGTVGFVAATSEPTVVDPSDDLKVVAGGGTGLAVSLASSTAWAASTSDGGLNWSEVTAPSGDVLLGLAYSEDFLGQGPAFVAHTRTISGPAWNVYQSTNGGSSWTEVMSSADFTAGLGPDQAGGRSWILDDTLIWLPGGAGGPDVDRNTIRVLDLSQKEGFRISMGLNFSDNNTLSVAAFDGVRFYGAVSDSGGDYRVVMSPPIAVPPLWRATLDDFV